MSTLAESAAPDFDDPALAAKVQSLPEAAVHALPYGAVRLDADGRVTFFSRSEGALSGYGDRPALGLQFFVDIAPCMNQPAFRGRLDQGLASGRLEAHFTWIGDFRDRDRLLEVRMQGLPGGGCWLFMRRDD